MDHRANAGHVRCGDPKAWARVLATLVDMNWTAEVLEPIIEDADRIAELPEAMPWLSVRWVTLGSMRVATDAT